MGLLNVKYIDDVILRDASWASSHGAYKGYLGGGMLYYCLVYMHAVRTCVCLGSGGGFVPRLMAQAQRDLVEAGIPGSFRTLLVDGDMGPWGRPDWMHEDSFFLREFPEIEVFRGTTMDAQKLFEQKKLRIGYLHIDADHSYEGCLADLRGYLPIVVDNGFVTLHDASPLRNSIITELGVCKAIRQIREEWNLEVVWFNGVGNGEVPEGVALMVNRGRK